MEADVRYWRQQVKRLEALVAAGAISRQEFDQAQNSLRPRRSATSPRSTPRCAKAGRAPVLPRRARRTRAWSATSRSGRAIASRTSTVITTIDDNSGARGLHPGAARSLAGPARWDCRCRSSTRTARSWRPTRSRFVAPRVDDATQTVLVKSAAARGAAAIRIAAVRSRRGSSGARPPALTVPVTAVTRINGQYFCLSPRQGDRRLGRPAAPDRGRRAARQRLRRHERPKAGEQLIVSGIQKIGDGAPVKARR